MLIVAALVVFVLSTAHGFIFFNTGSPTLQHYNVDRSQVSVSGISSGGAMATQMHVIYSSEFMGVGIIAGAPFACSEGSAAMALGTCMKVPSLVPVSVLQATTKSGATLGNIDAISNMADDKVYIFNGKADSVVNPGIGPVIRDFYTEFISDPSNIKTVFNINAQHSQPTDNYGGRCSQLSTDFINNCNYSAAYDLLNFFYGGNLQRPTHSTQQNGQLLQYDQADFFYVPFSTPALYSMDSIGYVYVPSGCIDKSKRCRLHVAFHGCSQGRKSIGDHYVRHGGYNEVAELNDIIILYPQAIATATNPGGCWDWWGYTGPLFATNNGFQPIALRRMVHKVIGV